MYPLFPRDIWNYLLTEYCDFETCRAVSICCKKLRTLFWELQTIKLGIFKHIYNNEFDFRNRMDINFHRLTQAAVVLSTTLCSKKEWLKQFYLWNVKSLTDLKNVPCLVNYNSFQKDVELVCFHVTVRKAVAFYSLLKHNGDIVNAIMDLLTHYSNITLM